MRAPAARDVQIVDELLNALQHFLVGRVVLADEGRHIGVKRRESLSASPFVLHRAEEVDNLACGRREVLGRSRFDLARNAVEALLQKRAQTPARAVTRKHVQIVNVKVGLTVALTDFGRVDVVEPIVGDHLARNIENQAAQTVALIGVGVNTPVGLIEVFVNRAFDVNPALLGIAAARTLLAVNDVCAKGFKVTGFIKRMFNGVLHLLDMRRCHAQLTQSRHHERFGNFFGAFAAELIGGLAGAFDGVSDLLSVKVLYRTVAFDDVLDLYCHFLCTFVVVCLRRRQPAPSCVKAAQRHQKTPLRASFSWVDKQLSTLESSQLQPLRQ